MLLFDCLPLQDLGSALALHGCHELVLELLRQGSLSLRADVQVIEQVARNDPVRHAVNGLNDYFIVIEFLRVLVTRTP